MKDHLLDLLQHTLDLGCIDTIKVTGTDQETNVVAVSTDQNIVLTGKFKNPLNEFVGVFGMPNISKLKILLNLQEYKENAVITIQSKEINGESTPAGMHFENSTHDFKNDYRFMTKEVVADALKTPKFKGVTWHIEFEPTIASILRLKMQASANAEENNFRVKTDKGDLKFSFGDHSTHAGEFVFQSDVNGTLKHSWAWPAKQVISILDLVGDKVIHISDDGAMKIVVDSGIAEYTYILPAQSK